MRKLQLTKGIKESMKEFKENHENRKFTDKEFKIELFKILSPGFPKVQMQDIHRWCRVHDWILEKPDKPKAKVARKYVSLLGRKNGNPSSSVGRSNATSETFSFGEQEEILGLPNNVGNHSIAMKTEIFTPQTSRGTTQDSHNHGETSQSSICEGGQNSEVTSDESIVTVLRDANEAPRNDAFLGLAPLPSNDAAAIPGEVNSVNCQPVFPLRPVPVRLPYFAAAFEHSLQFMPSNTVAAASTSAFPDSSMPHLSAEEFSSNGFTVHDHPPPPSPRNVSPINQEFQERPSTTSSYNDAHDYIPPPEDFNYSDPSHLKDFYGAFVAVRSLTDLCLKCPQLQRGLLHLEGFTRILSRVNSKITIPTTYSQALEDEQRRIKKERKAKGYDTDYETEPETEDEREATVPHLPNRMNATATNGNRNKTSKRSHRDVVTLD